MRPGTPIPLTLEEHRELGIEIRTARVRMRQLCELVAGVYGPANQASVSFLRAVEDLDRLSQDLRAQALKDWPDYPLDKIYL
jgi:hypothetical protein